MDINKPKTIEQILDEYDVLWKRGNTEKTVRMFENFIRYEEEYFMEERFTFVNEKMEFDDFWDMMIKCERKGDYFETITLSRIENGKYRVYVEDTIFSIDQQELLNDYGFEEITYEL